LCVERLDRIHNINSYKRAQENHLFTLGKAMNPNYSPKVVADKRLKYGPHKNKDIRAMFGTAA